MIINAKPTKRNIVWEQIIHPRYLQREKHIFIKEGSEGSL